MPRRGRDDSGSPSAFERSYSQGGKIPLADAPRVYDALQKTPFVSLYGSLNWTDDLAEYVAAYHLTEVLKQPYRIVIREDDRALSQS